MAIIADHTPRAYAPTGWIGRIADGVRTWRLARRRAAARRAAFEVLCGLNPATLSDLGMRREDIEAVALGVAARVGQSPTSSSGIRVTEASKR